MKIDQIIHTKRRTIALIVNNDGRLIVRAPLRATQKQILQVVDRKADWIKSKQELVKTRNAQFVPKAYANGEEFLYLGKFYKLLIQGDTKHPLRLGDQFYISKKDLARAELVFKKWYIDQAKKVITGRVDNYAAIHGFLYHQVKITSAQTRWGSCSPSGNLNFSWRLVMAPMQVIDYVVIHELVHLQVKNHSNRFWDKVKVILPGYAQQLKWLKIYGHMLRLD